MAGKGLKQKQTFTAAGKGLANNVTVANKAEGGNCALN
ncbi:hypothetical protein B4113_3585 [Geobacillus sp. B4113_201601]|nr:hypothetical protein B4113_3585 [Geobacillus sp. B4113_201601]